MAAAAQWPGGGESMQTGFHLFPRGGFSTEAKHLFCFSGIVFKS